MPGWEIRFRHPSIFSPPQDGTSDNIYNSRCKRVRQRNVQQGSQDALLPISPVVGGRRGSPEVVAQKQFNIEDKANTHGKTDPRRRIDQKTDALFENVHMASIPQAVIHPLSHLSPSLSPTTTSISFHTTTSSLPHHHHLNNHPPSTSARWRSLLPFHPIPTFVPSKVMPQDPHIHRNPTITAQTPLESCHKPAQDLASDANHNPTPFEIYVPEPINRFSGQIVS